MGFSFARSALCFAFFTQICLGAQNEIWEEPEENWGAVSIYTTSCSAKKISALLSATSDACDHIKDVEHAMLNYDAEITETAKKGINLPIYAANKRFYQTRLASRIHACDHGKISYKCVGACATDRETTMYVLVNLFGRVGTTIHVCDEFFSSAPGYAKPTVAHEFGRLEGIGDSPEFDTDNIYVWDAILNLVGDPLFVKMLQEKRAKQK